MKATEILLSTLKEVPKDAEAISHQLMLRSGMIRRLSSGLYCYLPVGFKVLLKVINIIREEMNKANAQEVLLPAIQPLELWEKTGRINALGDDMIKFSNRSGKNMVLGPTHEEVITWLISQEVSSYKQLPIIMYQIQTKFRDEPRPRFGVIRTCEFIMKDAYSFNASWESLDESYKKMYDVYCRIFKRCGLDFIAVEADPGIMGGDISHEFMAITKYGEDKIVVCKKCRYSASRNVAQRSENVKTDNEKENEKKDVKTDAITSVENVAKYLKVSAQKILKTIIYKSAEELLAVIIRGDHEVNEIKLRKYLKTKDLRMATGEEIKELTKADVGFSGPCDLKIRLIADYDVRGLKNAVTGANRTGYHFLNVNIKRDFDVKEFADLRFVEDQDICPKCKSFLKTENALEVGHIFKLGTRYSKPLEAQFSDEKGEKKDILMGCYGIGVNRILAAFIEQNNDEKGILWARSIAPYDAVVITTNSEDKNISSKASEVYDYLIKEGFEALYDDRDVRVGLKFNDADLLGIPYQIIVGAKFLKEGIIEFRSRNKKINADIADKKDILKYLK